MSAALREKSISFGIAAMFAATLALFISVAHLSLGPIETQKPIEQTIAETALKIKEAAKRAVNGEEAPVEPQASKFNWDVIVTISGLGLAACAMLLSIVALMRRENQSPAYVGFSLGAGVLLMTWLQWIALMICGVILLFAIINNLESILP